MPHGLHCPKCHYRRAGHPPVAVHTKKHAEFASVKKKKKTWAHSRRSSLPQTPSLLSVVSLSSSTAWSWTQWLADQRWRTHGSPIKTHPKSLTSNSSLSLLRKWIVSLTHTHTSSPIQEALGPTTCVFHRGYCWLHLLIYPESSHHRTHCPVRSHCLEKRRCLVDVLLRNRHLEMQLIYHQFH